MAAEPFEAIMRSLDPNLIVVTTAAGEERAGCLVGFHSQSSIAPERYAVWLSKANHTYRVGLRATHVGIHFLTDADRALAVRFGTLTGDTTDKFAGLDVDTRSAGVPVLRACPNWLVLRRTALLDEGGDHVCLALEPVSGGAGRPFTPLRLSAVDDLTPGHDNDERHDPPTERAGPE